LPNQSYNHLIADSSKTTGSVVEYFSPSFFNNHLLSSINEKPIVHYTKYDYLPAIILFAIFTFFVWIYVENRKFLNQLVKNYFFNRFDFQSFKQENYRLNRATIILSVVFLLLLSLFIEEIIKFYIIDSQTIGEYLFFKIAGSIVFMYLLKILTTSIFGYIFKKRKEANDYIITILMFWNVLGLFLMPIVVCLLFLKQVPPQTIINIGVVIIGLFLLLRFWKTIMIGLNSARISMLYLFLYLCTLEILPFIILYKLFLISN
jgi:hypothetical protein